MTRFRVIQKRGLCSGLSWAPNDLLSIWRPFPRDAALALFNLQILSAQCPPIATLRRALPIELCNTFDIPFLSGLYFRFPCFAPLLSFPSQHSCESRSTQWERDLSNPPGAVRTSYQVDVKMTTNLMRCGSPTSTRISDRKFDRAGALPS